MASVDFEKKKLIDSWQLFFLLIWQKRETTTQFFFLINVAL